MNNIKLFESAQIRSVWNEVDIDANWGTICPPPFCHSRAGGNLVGLNKNVFCLAGSPSARRRRQVCRELDRTVGDYK